jgi:hypothetical protein
MIDILLDESFDLAIANDDFVIGNAVGQHQKILLLSSKGELKQFPVVGIGISEALADDNLATLRQEILKQFELDGMIVDELIIGSNGDVALEAYYV